MPVEFGEGDIQAATTVVAGCCGHQLAYKFAWVWLCLVRTAFIGICLLGIADWTVGFFVQIKEET